MLVARVAPGGRVRAAYSGIGRSALLFLKIVYYTAFIYKKANTHVRNELEAEHAQRSKAPGTDAGARLAMQGARGRGVVIQPDK